MVAKLSYGPLMIDLEGLQLSAEERELLSHPMVGGVLLFTRNYEHPDQLTGLVKAIRSVRESLLVAVDYEGGRVQRFHDGFTRLPPPHRIGEIYDAEPEQALGLARCVGWLIGSELRAMAIDLPFAPVLDLDTGLAEVIGDRAWHSQPEAVAALAGACRSGLQQAGLAATGKHFPGHGRVTVDSHEALPVDSRSRDEVRDTDLIPFAELIKVGLESIMAAHIRYPEVDELPASLSPVWIEEELRGRLGFEGTVFCDDLSMGGAVAALGDCHARARQALEAGCDMLPVCNDRGAVVELLDRLHWKVSTIQRARLAALRAKPGNSLAALQATRNWSDAANAMKSILEMTA